MKKILCIIACLGFLVYCQAPSISSENLTITVLKPPINEAVQFVSKGGYIVGFRLICVNAAADTVIDQIFTEGYNQGDPVGEFRIRIGTKMQDAIDAYQERHTLFNAAAFDATPAWLESALDGGV